MMEETNVGAQFAKLFDTARGQILVTTDTKDGQDGEYGPCLVIRAAGTLGVTPQISHGPWSDDEAGWDHVDKLLADFDQSQADDWAEKFHGMLTRLAGAA